MAFKKLSIIIPAFNEEATIAAIISKVRAAVLPNGLSREIIVVDDGSTDGTSSIAQSLVAHDLVYLHQHNQGKAGAIKAGFRQATGDILLIQDADLEYDPIQYPQLLQPIIDGKTQVVYGSRFLGKIRDMHLVNHVANAISNITFRLLWRVPLTDINTCYKVFTRQALEGIEIKTSQFALETELTIKILLKGLSIFEIPIHYEARTRQEGKKIRWSTALEMFWPIIKHRFIRPQ